MEPITLATLPNATAQQVFDYVVTHLRKQGRKSALPASSRGDMYGPCQYRMTTEDGTVLRCAAGCLIADSEYIPAYEGRSWGFLSLTYNIADVTVPPKDRSVPNSHALLIKQFQYVHDSVEINLWEKHFEEVAEENKLVYAAPETK